MEKKNMLTKLLLSYAKVTVLISTDFDTKKLRVQITKHEVYQNENELNEKVKVTINNYT